MAIASYIPNGRFLYCGFYTAIFTLICGTLVIFFALFRLPRHWSEKASAFWARIILTTAGVKVHLEGQECLTSDSVVLVGNHQSIFDILVLIAYLPRSPVFVAKKELFKVPLFGQALYALGHIPVDRSNSQKAIESINKGTIRLKENSQNVVFFPEGTRTRDGKIKPFKKGAFAFALQSKLPIVPLVIHGSYEVLPPNSKRVNPGPIYVQFTSPIETHSLILEERDILLQRTQERIEENYQKLRSKYVLDFS